MDLGSTITCPECGFKKEEEMATESCLFFYKCTNCEKIIRPKPGDDYVFCSYGSKNCPSKQADAA